MTVNCPWECEFLQGARKHDRPVPLDGETLPNRDIHVSEEFVNGQEALLLWLGSALGKAAAASPEVVDFDAREALEACVRTWRTRHSGLYYETLPDNPLAAGLCGVIQEAVQKFHKAEKEETGVTKTRDADVLGLLVFLQRFELDRNNGRRRGRAFLHALRGFYPLAPEGGSPPPSSLILL